MTHVRIQRVAINQIPTLDVVRSYVWTAPVTESSSSVVFPLDSPFHWNIPFHRDIRSYWWKWTSGGKSVSQDYL